MMRGGRPSKLTPELQKRLCDAIASGNYLEAACGYAGVSYKVFRDWMKRGAKSNRGRFRNFRESVLKAQADAEVRIVDQWQQQCPDNWRACRDFLARRYPDRWGQRDSLELRGKKGQPLEMKVTEIVYELPTEGDGAGGADRPG